jgi:RNA polymerase sigma-70 factor (ECF subfamily)
MSRDERAFFHSVYQQVAPILLRVVFRITGDTDSAEEVCHDAFIQFYQHSTSLPDEQQARYWLLRVGKNLAFNLAKRRGRERSAYERAWFEPQRPGESADDPTLRDETAEIVRRAVASLPANLRDVIVLKEYGDLAYQEIADTLGISVGNVKVRVHRARERLARYLEDIDVHFPS